MTAAHEIFFIGGKGIYAEVLKPLVAISREASSSMIAMTIRQGRGVSLSQANEFIQSCCLLGALSLRVGVNKAAHIACLSEKSIYRIMSESARAMNFRSLLHFQYFLVREFSEGGSRYWSGGAFQNVDLKL
ncbi:hypothetical protein HAX39_24850 [Citrobacter freundii]|nr:hypothetical protein [Citrobacter freundii]